ncbi:hypothetical protein PHYPSEUDO_013701 [Phytophthora pseudosyringae]|uniref:Uncharacterized protein n=1 Tax=Phytophthora pseudosyringae TaxID=221518 RepID=A0A8T1V7T4_9STRA|nr:hypothetical protein PHYPSEUDO_013701 [Phytophthora pseudosyringae]
MLDPIATLRSDAAGCESTSEIAASRLCAEALKVADYILELDDAGEIIGGECVYDLDSDHPDFLCTRHATVMQQYKKQVLTQRKLAALRLSTSLEAPPRRESSTSLIGLTPYNFLNCKVGLSRATIAWRHHRHRHHGAACSGGGYGRFVLPRLKKDDTSVTNVTISGARSAWRSRAWSSTCNGPALQPTVL